MNEKQIRNLFCKWCPYDAEADSLTQDDIDSCVAINGFMKELKPLLQSQGWLSPEQAARVKYTPAKVIVLCGSTRFTHDMLIKQWELTKQGNVVMSWCALPDDYFQGEDKTHIGDQEGVKEIVDEVHKRKIDLADEVLVLNIGGYIGKSTRSEIDYAIAHNKPVKYQE